LGYRANIAHEQARALRVVKQNGGMPLYAHDISGSRPPFAPKFVRDWLGEDLFARVVRLNFTDGLPGGDEAFSTLDGLPYVTVINTSNSKLSDAALENIPQARKLTTLRLPGAPLTDRGLEYVGQLRRLTLLDLGGTGVTDAGIRHLAPLTRLEILSLQGASLTDASVPDLSKLASLKLLNIGQTGITPDGVAAIQRNLPDCQILASN
jgi:hypothetical protein